MSDNPKKMNGAPETLAAQGLGWTDPASGAVSLGIHPSSTFLRDPDNQYRRGRIYARDDNPDLRPARSAAGGAGAGRRGGVCSHPAWRRPPACFMALKPGDHVVAPAVMYWSLRNWLIGLCARMGACTSISSTCRIRRRSPRRSDPAHTRLVWVETPANPLWNVTDIAAVARTRPWRRRAAGRRFDGGDARAVATADAGRRYRHAFGHQISSMAIPMSSPARWSRVWPTIIGSGSRLCVSRAVAFLVPSKPGC